MNRQRGFTLVELILAVAVLAILATLIAPSFLRYLRASEIQASGREVTAILAQARAEAIRRNCTISATRTTGGFNFARGADCIGGAGSLVVPGMTSAGLYKTSNAMSLSGLTTATFTRLGNASASGQFTVTSTKYNTAIRVIVDPTGRVWIQQ